MLQYKNNAIVSYPTTVLSLSISLSFQSKHPHLLLLLPPDKCITMYIPSSLLSPAPRSEINRLFVTSVGEVVHPSS